MKLIGKVNEYNGKYGTIITNNNDVVDFSNKDISFNQRIDIGDEVEFRLEIKVPDIKIARNVNVINKNI